MAFSTFRETQYVVGDLIGYGELNRMRDNMSALAVHDHSDVGADTLTPKIILFDPRMVASGRLRYIGGAFEIANYVSGGELETRQVIGLPRNDELTPYTLQLQEGDTAHDLDGSVVIVQSGVGGINAMLNGTYTIAVSDIRAAGSGGYVYVSQTIGGVGFNHRVCSIRVDEEEVIIDVTRGDGELVDTRVNFDSISYQVSVNPELTEGIIEDRPHAASHNQGGGDALTPDRAVSIASTRTLGTGAQQAAAGTHTH